METVKVITTAFWAIIFSFFTYVLVMTDNWWTVFLSALFMLFSIIYVISIYYKGYFHTLSILRLVIFTYFVIMAAVFKQTFLVAIFLLMLLYSGWKYYKGKDENN